MKVLKSRIVLRNVIFLVVVYAAFPVYAGNPLIDVFGCFDHQLTFTGGSPAAGCFGFGQCSFTGSGDLFVDILLFSNMDCPNQAVFNEVSVTGTMGSNCLLGNVQGWCADSGRPRGQRVLQSCCDGHRFDSGPITQPNNCFLPPIFGDPPLPPPPGGIIYCYNLEEQYNCQEFAGIWDSNICRCDYYSPIVIDTEGNGFDLTDTNGGINFDLKPDNIAERIAWTRSDTDDAFLVLDRSGNGLIDNGAELFGNFTLQPPSPNRNGFLALAEFDKHGNGGNGDGVINQRDAIFSSLRLWKNLNHNGVSEPQELATLVASKCSKNGLGFLAIESS